MGQKIKTDTAGTHFQTAGAINHPPSLIGLIQLCLNLSDIEGAEEFVLRSIPWDKIDIDLGICQSYIYRLRQTS